MKRILGILFLCSPAWAVTCPSGYTNYSVITIDHTKVPNTDKSNFPVLVSTTVPNLKTTGNGGHVQSSSGFDIVFSTANDGSSFLVAFDTESYSASTGKIETWVKIPTVSHTADTVFYVYYNNSGVSSFKGNTSGTWDTNYQAVYHMFNGTTLSANDATGNHNGTLENSPIASAGQIDGAGGFATGSYIGSPGFYKNASDLNTGINDMSFTNGTIEWWVYYGYVYNDGAGDVDWGQLTDNTAGDPDFDCQKFADNNIYCGWNTQGGVDGRVIIAASSANHPQNTFTSYALVWTNGAQATLYHNGSLIGTAANNTTVQNAGSPLFISKLSAFTGLDLYGEQVMDEFRVSNTNRSADWIATAYNSESSPQTFFTYGAEQTCSAGAATLGSNKANKLNRLGD